jgi:hypothetical protein
VLDDISALRQASPDVVSSDAFLFKPAEAILIPQNTDNGTPTQKDEPEADNPPNGAVIDYYLKAAASGPVTIEILNAGGAVIRRYSSSDPPPVVDVSTLAVNLAWARPVEPLSAAAGMHRWVWDFRPDPPAGGRGRGGRGGGSGGGGAGPRRPPTRGDRHLLRAARGERQVAHGAARGQAGSEGEIRCAAESSPLYLPSLRPE